MGGDHRATGRSCHGPSFVLLAPWRMLHRGSSCAVQHLRCNICTAQIITQARRCCQPWIANSIDSVLRSLRRVNLQGSLFGHTVALRFGLSESDIEALEVLIDSGAATAGKLSDLTGLTTGAVTRVIDRLEQSGYVRRVPDPTDRRRVIVELVPERMAASQRPWPASATRARRRSATTREAELAVIDDFLTRMAAIRRDEATALRSSPEEAGDAGSEHAAPIGGLGRARLLFKSGAHELLLRGATDIDDLYRARFEGSIPQVRLRDGIVTIQYKGWGATAPRPPTLSPTGSGAGTSGARCLAQRRHPVGRRGRRRGRQAPGKVRGARPSLVRADGRGRSAPADPWPAGGRRPHPADPRGEQHPDRATDRGPRPAASSTAAPAASTSISNG